MTAGDDDDDVIWNPGPAGISYLVEGKPFELFAGSRV
jgi:hypothetical protein